MREPDHLRPETHADTNISVLVSGRIKRIFKPTELDVEDLAEAIRPLLAEDRTDAIARYKTSDQICIQPQTE
jgi:hypothetical protein